MKNIKLYFFSAQYVQTRLQLNFPISVSTVFFISRIIFSLQAFNYVEVEA